MVSNNYVFLICPSVLIFGSPDWTVDSGPVGSDSTDESFFDSEFLTQKYLLSKAKTLPRSFWMSWTLCGNRKHVALEWNKLQFNARDILTVSENHKILQLKYSVIFDQNFFPRLIPINICRKTNLLLSRGARKITFSFRIGVNWVRILLKSLFFFKFM